MSATLDAERFSNYFGGCPVIRVPGFTYPVTATMIFLQFSHFGFILQTEYSSTPLYFSGQDFLLGGCTDNA